MKTLLHAAVFSLAILLGSTHGHAQYQISGTLTNKDGNAIGGRDILIYLLQGDSWTPWDSTFTNTSGEYSSSSLESGVYRVEFTSSADLSFSRTYVREFYNNTTEFGSATNIPVDGNATLTGIDAVLNFTQISGNVTASDGSTPLRDIKVQAFRFVNPDWVSVAVGETDSEGRYLLGGITPLPDGPNSSNVRLKFEDPSGAYLTAFYSANGTVAAIDQGTDINVFSPIDSDVIDISLQSSAAPIDPQILGVESVGGGQFDLLFVGQSGVNFQVQKSTDLTAGSWNPYGAPFPATGQPQSIRVTQEGSKTFWKISEVADQ
jgi:5-hydroxyisourate hydrolase-like protein (transthyretin family)